MSLDHLNHFPLSILVHLESISITLTIRDGQLFGKRGSTEEIRNLVRDNKAELIAVLMKVCPGCGSALRETDNERYRAMQCSSDAVCYAEVHNKNLGQPMFIGSGGVKPERCADCGGHNNGPYKYCDKCWLKIIDADGKEVTGDLFE